MAVTETFRRHDSGLYVPEDVSRQREVWTKDEGRLLARVTTLLRSRGLKVAFGCTDPRCQTAPLERIESPGGGMLLRCAHKDRHFVRGF